MRNESTPATNGGSRRHYDFSILQHFPENTMSLRKSLAGLIGATLLLGGATVSSQATAAEKITIGTLAPASSPWGKVFKAWARALKKKTGGELELKFYFNGGQGDERAMINKMR
ncbi:MAG: TRAP transporter substrate-binding protein DctP, partial [Polyangiaceae bacterium]